MSSSFGTNEEIVEDLTKNLKQSSIDSTVGEITSDSPVEKSENDFTSLEKEEGNEETESTSNFEVEEEFIDEESLRERDAHLSSEEKEVR